MSAKEFADSLIPIAICAPLMYIAVGLMVWPFIPPKHEQTATIIVVLLALFYIFMLIAIIRTT